MVHTSAWLANFIACFDDGNTSNTSKNEFLRVGLPHLFWESLTECPNSCIVGRFRGADRLFLEYKGKEPKEFQVTF